MHRNKSNVEEIERLENQQFAHWHTQRDRERERDSVMKMDDI